MDLLKELANRIFCRHSYEFRARYFRIINRKVQYFEDFQCSKCRKRKEKKIK